MTEQIFLTINEWLAGGTIIAFLGSFLWGMVSVLFSPCHLASIPLIVVYVGGQERVLQPREAGYYSLTFTSGLFITIALIGVISVLLGRMLGDIGNYWQILVGVILIWVALGMLGVEKFSMSGSLLYRLKLKGLLGALVLGLAYGVLSGSCTFGFIAPILAIISVQKEVSTGLLLILLFAVGHCLPIVIAGSSTAAVRKVVENQSWQTGGQWFRRLAGILIGMLGIYFIISPFVFFLMEGQTLEKGPHNHNQAEIPWGRRLILAMILNLIIPLIEIYAGIIAGSMALISDALHNLSDLTSLMISYAALKIGGRGPSLNQTFGYRRVEVMAAVFNVALLFGAAFYIAAAGWGRLKNPVPIQGTIVIWVALAAFAANGLSTLLLHSGAKENLNLRAAFLHMLVDALTSIGVALLGVIWIFRPWYWLDPLVSWAIVALILYSGWGIIKAALLILMNATPPGMDLQSIQQEVEALEGIKGMHHLHVWNPSSGSIALAAHIIVPDQPLSKVDEMAAQVRELLYRRFKVDHPILQFETEGYAPMDLLCSLCGQEGPVALQKQPLKINLTVLREEKPGALVRPDNRVAEGKETQDTDLICYCFGYTRRDIQQDIIKNGRSLILEKISAEKKAGACDCAAKNPKGG